ncbi:serine hydrolase [Streptomyces sp. NPDC001920]
MPEGQPHRTYDLRAHALKICTATTVLASLAACSPTAITQTAQSPSVRPAAVAPGPPAPRENLRDTLARALKPVRPGRHTRLAVAVLDLDSADRVIASYGQKTTFDTASIIKVGILATLLLQAQDEGHTPSTEQRRMAEAMIRSSDNGATHALWQAIGEAEGLDAANERLGLSSTRGGHGMRWGLTQTTATDQVRLLRAVFGRGASASPRSPEGLNHASRAYIKSLMGSVEEEQDWGVSAAGSPGSRWALKNGWLQRTTTGLWVINSIGQVTVHGRRHLVSVLSDGNVSMQSGISLVERAARAAIGAASAHARPWPM